MKFFAKLILVILFIPLSLIIVLSSTIKFQLLDPSFWKATLKENNVYSSLSVKFKTIAENQTTKGGGKTADLKTLTDVITPNIVEDFISRNLDNFLGFANGKRNDLIVYLPINKIPKEFAPKSVGLNTEEIPLNSLLSKFNIEIGKDIPISQIAYFGRSVNYLLIGSTLLFILIVLFLVLLTEKGKKFLSLGIPFIISGIFIFIIVKFGNSISKSILVDWVNSTEPSQLLLSTFSPYILEGVLKIWLVVGFAFTLIGTLLLFFKKP